MTQNKNKNTNTQTKESQNFMKKNYQKFHKTCLLMKTTNSPKNLLFLLNFFLISYRLEFRISSVGKLADILNYDLKNQNKIDYLR